jgi:hypothetical protein
MSKAGFDHIGGFDEGIRGASTEDLDLWIRFAKQYTVAYVAEPLVVYRRHPNNGCGNGHKMLEDEFFVLDKALKADPELLFRLDSTKALQRVADLAFQAGYSNVEHGQIRRARHYFTQSLGYRPISLKTVIFWLSTLIPARGRSGLRHLKRSMGQRIS